MSNTHEITIQIESKIDLLVDEREREKDNATLSVIIVKVDQVFFASFISERITEKLMIFYGHHFDHSNRNWASCVISCF